MNMLFHFKLLYLYLNVPENATPDQKKDFLDEINLMKAVGSHKNIASLIGCCTKSSPNFLIVEFASQGDLLSYLKECRKKVKIVTYVCSIRYDVFGVL